MSGCISCGVQTPNRKCRECRLMERAEEAAQDAQRERDEDDEEIVTDGGAPLYHSKPTERRDRANSHFCEVLGARRYCLKQDCDLCAEDDEEVDGLLTDGGEATYEVAHVVESLRDDPRNDTPAGTQTVLFGRNPDPDYDVLTDDGVKRITHETVETIRVDEPKTEDEWVEYLEEEVLPLEDDEEEAVTDGGQTREEPTPNPTIYDVVELPESEKGEPCPLAVGPRDDIEICEQAVEYVFVYEASLDAEDDARRNCLACADCIGPADSQQVDRGEGIETDGGRERQFAPQDHVLVENLDGDRKDAVVVGYHDTTAGGHELFTDNTDRSTTTLARYWGDVDEDEPVVAIRYAKGVSWDGRVQTWSVSTYDFPESAIYKPETDGGTPRYKIAERVASSVRDTAKRELQRRASGRLSDDEIDDLADWIEQQTKEDVNGTLKVQAAEQHGHDLVPDGGLPDSLDEFADPRTDDDRECVSCGDVVPRRFLEEGVCIGCRKRDERGEALADGGGSFCAACTARVAREDRVTVDGQIYHRQCAPDDAVGYSEEVPR